MTPIEVQCPYCHRPPGRRCRNSSQLDVALDKTHRKRVKAAAEAAEKLTPRSGR